MMLREPAARRQMEELLDEAASGAPDDELRERIAQLRRAIASGRAACAACLAIDLWTREVLPRVAVIDGKVVSSRKIAPDVRRGRKVLDGARAGGQETRRLGRRGPDGDALRVEVEALLAKNGALSRKRANTIVGGRHNIDESVVRRRIKEASGE